MSDIAKLIGERIRNFRKERDWSQEEFADIANINRTYIGQLERGERSATLDSLEKITGALGITFEDLFRHLQPSTEYKDNTTLSYIINILNTLDLENQEIVLDLLKTLYRRNVK